MKKICIISQVYKPEIGASQHRLSEMAIGLKKFGWEVAVITAMPNYPHGKIFDDYKGKFRLTEVLDEIEIRRYWLYPSNSRRAFPRILSWLSFSVTVLYSLGFIRRKRFDFILVQSPPMIVGLSVLLLNRLSYGRMILNVSDLWPKTAKELGAISDGKLYRYFESLEKRLYSKSFLCIGQSQEIIEHLNKRGAKRTYLFNNGVDPTRFNPSNISNPANTTKIVYAGLLGVAQGIVNICKNIDFNELGIELHIYGAGPEQGELEEFLSEHPERGIFYYGQIQKDRIPDEMNKYVASLIPLVRYISGAVPSKLYESMAAGLPILYSGDGEACKIINKHNLGWISPANDYKRLSKNIRKLVSDYQDVQIKRQNCLYAAKHVFNRNIQIKELHLHLSSYLQPTNKMS